MKVRGQNLPNSTVRTQIVTNLTVLGSHVKMPLTMSFVERGIERLGLGHRIVVWGGSGQ